MILRIFVVCCSLLTAVRSVAAEKAVELNGPWTFALDPLDRGEQLGWHKPPADWTGERAAPAGGWDEVAVPHDFLSDPRYEFTGVGWYRRSFVVPEGAPAEWIWRLMFASVFQRCRVWLNGELLGTHEGGYTPFEFLLGPSLRRGRQNFLVVAVDNRVGLRDLPGARTGTTPTAQVYPWLNYGGIVGAVRLVGHPPVFIAQQNIRTTPDLKAGTAAVSARVRVHNATTEPRAARVAVVLSSGQRAEREAIVAARSEEWIDLALTMPRTDVKLWSLDEQPLYTARATVAASGAEHAREDTFGIRHLEVRDAKFFLNGKPVRMAGANRARGHPVHGGLDPDAAVALDMEMMKAAGLRFARLQHTAPGRNLLDWADRQGMLLILEVGVWGSYAADLASTELQARYQAEMRELIALAENSPSVVGWSLGNEYETWTPQGVAWTREMAKFVKALDPTRPVTTPALGVALRRLTTDPVTEHAFDHVDIISANLYSAATDVPGLVDPLHVRWPNKPVFITEFGLRFDRVKSEQERIAQFDAYLDLVRARSWICGLSYWTFNDYRSRYPGTGLDGFRRWGMVDEHRKPRALYEHVKRRLAETNLDPTPR
jgi:beta-glucuronidase